VVLMALAGREAITAVALATTLPARLVWASGSSKGSAIERSRRRRSVTASPPADCVLQGFPAQALRMGSRQLQAAAAGA
jgi:hypothetical protein